VSGVVRHHDFGRLTLYGALSNSAAIRPPHRSSADRRWFRCRKGQACPLPRLPFLASRSAGPWEYLIGHRSPRAVEHRYSFDDGLEASGSVGLRRAKYGDDTLPTIGNVTRKLPIGLPSGHFPAFWPGPGSLMVVRVHETPSRTKPDGFNKLQVRIRRRGLSQMPGSPPPTSSATPSLPVVLAWVSRRPLPRAVTCRSGGR
jgi:hypothetical protein